MFSRGKVRRTIEEGERHRAVVLGIRAGLHATRLGIEEDLPVAQEHLADGDSRLGLRLVVDDPDHPLLASPGSQIKALQPEFPDIGT